MSSISCWTAGIVVVEVGLMAVEAVPEVLPGDRVPGPVGGLGVAEDDPRPLVDLVGVAPDVVVALGGVRVAPGLLEPGMLVGSVVDHEVGDDPDAAGVGGLGQRLEVGDGADRGMDLAEIGDVVAVVLQGRGVDGHEPEAVDAQLLEVVELGSQADQVAVAVAVGVVETPDVDLVEDGVLVPEVFGSRHGDDLASRIAQRSGDKSRTTFSASSRGQPGRQARAGNRPSAPWPRPRPRATSAGDETKRATS